MHEKYASSTVEIIEIDSLELPENRCIFSNLLSFSPSNLMDF